MSLGLIAAACGGDEFASSAGPGGTGGGGALGATGGVAGQAASAGAGASAGAAGSGGLEDAGVAGSPATGGVSAGGAAGSGGAGGVVAVDAGPACSCAAGSYCDAFGGCRSCSDFSRFQFGRPEKLAAVSNTAQGSERFPRPFGDTSLFYRAGATGAEALRFTGNFLSSGGLAISGSNVESGPLRAELSVGSVAASFFFDRGAADRDLYGGQWNGSSVTGAVPLPAPLNSPNPLPDSSMPSDYSIAVAMQAGRVFWMSNRGTGKAALLTTAVNPFAPATVNLMVRTPSGASCARGGFDATPWVTPEGDILLFRNFPVDDSCNPLDGDASDLFFAEVDPASGQPLGAGQPIGGVNHGGESTETDPALSADFCWLFFASDGGQANGYDFDLYRAPRN